MAAIYVPKNKAAVEHRGRLDRVIFSDPAQPFLIALLDDGATVVGPADAEQFARGVIYRFLGRWEDTDKRGPRFKFSTFLIHAAHSKVGVVKLLTEVCEGIGMKTAAKLFDKFGGEAVSILRDNPGRVADDCGIDAAICGEAARQLQRDARFADTRIELFTLFDRRGFPGKLIDQCLDEWQENAPATIRRNPFALLGMSGAGFKRCDKLWSDLGLPKDSLKRSGIVAWNLVKNDTNGHTWLSATDLAARLTDMIPGCDVKRAFKFALRARKLKKHADASGKMWLGTYHRATSEERIAASIKRLTLAESLWPTDRIPVSQTDGDKLPSEHQVERLKRATRLPVGLLLGGPGTGKSHITAYLLREVIAQFGRSSVLACAPTGKAAVRMTQAFGLAGLDVTASTIHRTLEIGRNGHDGDGWGFMRNRGNPLDAKFIVADECFVSGTLVDTPSGRIPIESIVPGDDVYSAAGVDQVRQVRRKEVTHAVRITAGEATFVCSENHPFLTCRGWVSAIDLEPGDTLVSTAKAMRLLRGDHHSDKVESGTAAFLRSCLLSEMVDAIPRAKSEVPFTRSTSEIRQGTICLPAVGHTPGPGPSRTDSPTQPDGQSRESCESVCDSSGHRSQAENSGRERPTFAKTAATPSRSSRQGLATGIRGSDSNQTAWFPDLLQAGSCSSEQETRHRSTELDRFRDAEGHLYLYDLAVTRHPSFSVNGCLVHNCSMDDTDLLADLLDAVPNGGHILLIGDPYQLPPVGHGAPLRDLIAGGLSHGELVQVRRNAGQIVHACVRIKNGESFDVADKIDLDAEVPKNLKLIEAKDEATASDALVETLKQMTRFHPVWQTQVIVARNKAGDLSRKKLNERLQPLLNPEGRAVAGNPFKVGDKIICLRNSRMHRVERIYGGQDADVLALDAANYDVIRDDNNQPEEVYIANGEIGRVVAVAAKLTIARFSEGEMLVKIPMGKQKDDEDEEGGEGESGRGCNFDHAYAVTCHKMQGSESPCVIIMADPQGGMIADRAWWYTAISRASKLCIIIGQKSTIDKQRLKQSLVKRKTFLNDLVFNALTEDL